MDRSAIATMMSRNATTQAGKTIMRNPSIEQYRDFLKDTIRQQVSFLEIPQNLGTEPPPLEEPFPAEARRTRLPTSDDWPDIGKLSVAAAIANRRSRRSYGPKPLTLGELSFLLWATQGIQARVNRATALRTVPSAGARHALETYLAVSRVDGLEPAFYRYLPLEHELVHLFEEPQMARRLTEAALGQAFVGGAAVAFIWTTIPYRMEWRYGLAAHKAIALDAGHVCQNLYLACEAIGAGTCAVGAYDQRLMDRLVRVDGSDEFVLYLAPVGKLSPTA
jgi:SagB-type dehydrogenase family enzyme